MTRNEVVWRIDRAAEERLTELNLKGLNLKELPPEIVKCTHLTRLDLRQNQITYLSEALGQLSSLEGLYL